MRQQVLGAGLERRGSSWGPPVYLTRDPGRRASGDKGRKQPGAEAPMLSVSWGKSCLKLTCVKWGGAQCTFH